MKPSFTSFAVIFSLIGFLAIGCSTSESSEKNTNPPMTKREFYELRTYEVSNADQEAKVNAYLKDALVPALNRLRISPVGVFNLPDSIEDRKVYMLIPHRGLPQFARVDEKLAKDEEYQKAGAVYLNISETEDRAFERIQSTLLMAFDSMPHMKLPAATASNGPRIFELRSYESFSEKKGAAKIHMFNEAGEVSIFKRLGMEPVFFAKAIIGPEQPNLVYMTTFDNWEERNKLWKAFGSDPKWESIKDLPEYKNTVSKSHKIFLVPTDFSQI